MDREDFDRWLLNTALFFMFVSPLIAIWMGFEKNYGSKSLKYCYEIFGFTACFLATVLITVKLILNRLKNGSSLIGENLILPVLIYAFSFLTNEAVIVSNKYLYGVIMGTKDWFLITFWFIKVCAISLLAKFVMKSKVLQSMVLIFIRWGLIYYLWEMFTKFFDLGINSMGKAMRHFFVFFILVSLNNWLGLKRVLFFKSFSFENRVKLSRILNFELKKGEKSSSVSIVNEVNILSEIKFVSYEFLGKFFSTLQYSDFSGDGFKIEIKKRGFKRVLCKVAYEDGTYSEHLIEGV